VLGGNGSESGIIILYSASEQGYLEVLALYKHALLYYYYYYTYELDPSTKSVNLLCYALTTTLPGNRRYSKTLNRLMNSSKFYILLGK